MIYIKIKIIGSNCSNGIKLKKMVDRAVGEMEETIEVEVKDEKKPTKNSNNKTKAPKAKTTSNKKKSTRKSSGN